MSGNTRALAIDDCDSRQSIKVLLEVGGVVMLSVVGAWGSCRQGGGRTERLAGTMMQLRVRDTGDNFSTPLEQSSRIVIDEQRT